MFVPKTKKIPQSLVKRFGETQLENEKSKDPEPESTSASSDRDVLMDRLAFESEYVTVQDLNNLFEFYF